MTYHTIKISETVPVLILYTLNYRGAAIWFCVSYWPTDLSSIEDLSWFFDKEIHQFFLCVEANKNFDTTECSIVIILIQNRWRETYKRIIYFKLGTLAAYTLGDQEKKSLM